MKRLFLSLFCVSILYCGHAFSQGAPTTPQIGPAVIAPNPNATPASPLEAAAQAAVTAAVSAAKQNLLTNLPMTPGVIGQLFALQTLFLSLLSGLQKLFGTLKASTAPVATPGAPVPAPSFLNKLFGWALTAVKAAGMNL